LLRAAWKISVVAGDATSWSTTTSVRHSTDP
jgi:hypothetical protein